MDVTLLRTLTEKSLLGFGRNADMRVGDLLALKKTRYLRWCYYNCSMISFMPDILRRIYIHEKDEIIKPGKDSEYGDRLNDRIFAGAKGINGIKAINVVKKRIRDQSKREYKSKRYRYSKSYMQSQNHGH